LGFELNNHSIGGYDKMMAWLEAGKIYDREDGIDTPPQSGAIKV
jgi:hypothetical protein